MNTIQGTRARGAVCFLNPNGASGELLDRAGSLRLLFIAVKNAQRTYSPRRKFGPQRRRTHRIFTRSFFPGKFLRRVATVANLLSALVMSDVSSVA